MSPRRKRAAEDGCLRAEGIEFHSRGAVISNDLDLRAVWCRGHTRALDLIEGPGVSSSAR